MVRGVGRASLSRNSLGTSSTYFVNQKTNIQHVGLRWAGLGRSEGSVMLEQMESRLDSNKNGRIDQDKNERIDPDKNGRLETSKNVRLETSKNGTLDSSKNGRLETSKNGRLETSKNGTLDSSKNGRLETSKNGRHDGGVAVSNGDPSGPRGSNGT